MEALSASIDNRRNHPIVRQGKVQVLQEGMQETSSKVSFYRLVQTAEPSRAEPSLAADTAALSASQRTTSATLSPIATELIYVFQPVLE